MDGQGEVGDEFTSCDEDDDGDGPEWIHVSMISVELHGVRTFGGEAYMQRPPSINQINDNNHPCVVSPRTPSHPSIMSTLNPIPATRAVKSMRIPAVT